MKKTLLCLAIVASACAAPAFAESDLKAITKLAKKSLISLQHQSFSGNREYCGMIGRTSAGELIASPARRGRTSGCNPRGFADKTIVPVASYHTHGAFDHMADAEVPSLADLDIDYADRVFGFVATPGGRFWMTDYRSRSIRQICGMGCLPADPAFKVGMAGDIPTEMTRREMAQREGVGGPRHLRARSLAKN
ncbi:DUF4329 domain-containing protein [uncultured Litoreibacter sp.]|uniref:DUF4329 domain-containing protein n=1 Tax=uncultured Litoreibacter sp. TaxID=1392394 RepID=UPI002634BF52|nr:DUF4329 domain-containing protein [uncultured Litoreibacter sp.]